MGGEGPEPMPFNFFAGEKTAKNFDPVGFAEVRRKWNIECVNREKVFAGVPLIFREEDRDTYFDNRDSNVFFLMFLQSFLIRTFPVFFFVDNIREHPNGSIGSARLN